MKRNLLQGISGDAIWLMIIKVVTMALNLIVTRLLSQYLSVYDYGTYSQILLIASTLSSLTVFGMIDGVNYFYCIEREQKTKEAYISTIFALQGIICAVMGTLTMLLCQPICNHLENQDLQRLLIFAALLPFFQNVLYMFQNLLVAVGKAKLLAFRNLAVSVLRLIITCFVVFFLRDVLVVLLTTVILDAVQILFFVWQLRGGCSIRLQNVDFRLTRRIFQYCAPMAIYVVIKTFSRDLDKYLISMVTDPETLAIYSNASKPLPLDIVMHSLFTVLIPQITRMIAGEENENATKLYKSFFEITLISNTILCLAVLAAAPQVMLMFYSKKYLSGLPIFCIYILVDLIQFTNTTLILSAAGKTKLLMLLSSGMLIGNGILNILFYRWWGILGPAVATFVATALIGILFMVLNTRVLQCRLRDAIDGKYLALFMLENLAVFPLWYTLQQWLVEAGVHYFFVICLVSGGYAVLMLLLNGKRMIRNLKTLNRTTA